MKLSKFGLPKKVIVCKKCVMTNQKPHSLNETKNKTNSKKKGMEFNKDDICAACRYSLVKEKKINWKNRELILKNFLKKYRKNDGSYDCIVPGSGGKDSMYAAYILKKKFGMNPLTVTFSPIQYTEIGWQNMRSWIDKGGFDNILFSPNGKIVKILAKEAFKNLLHPMQPFKFGIKNFAAKEALKHNIKLIFYGEPYSEYGSDSSKKVLKADYPKEWYVNNSKEIYLGGKNLNYYYKKYKIKKKELLPFLDLDTFIRHSKTNFKLSDIDKIKVQFLGWYLKWDPQEIYYNAVKHCGFRPDSERVDGTYGRYSGIDDKFEWIHFYCQYLKFGLARVRFEAAQEIRNGHITRSEGLALCKKFENEFPKRYFKDCMDFMGINEKEGLKIMDKFRPPHLWKKSPNGWKKIQ